MKIILTESQVQLLFEQESQRLLPDVVADVLKKCKNKYYKISNKKNAENAFLHCSDLRYYRRLSKLLGEDALEYIKSFMNINRVYNKTSIQDHYNTIYKLSNDGRTDGTNMKASQGFWDFVKYHEGDPKEKGEPVLKTYKDSAGVWTIGYGHTGINAKPGKTISKQQAQKILQNDATEAANCIRRMLGRIKNRYNPGYRLHQHEFDALVSLVFNSGCSGIVNSEVATNLENGYYTNAGKEILKYRSQGLENRRNAEYSLFITGKYK